MRSLKESIDLKIQMDALEAGSRQQNGILPSPAELSTKLHVFPSSTATSRKGNFVRGSMGSGNSCTKVTILNPQEVSVSPGMVPVTSLFLL